jgi:prepilin-type N-terminal cleavage/methylation domain-containing protein
MEMVSLVARNAFLGNGAMDHRRKGFTIIEVIVVLVIGGILMSFAVKAFGATASHTSARQARNVFNGMAARARAQAIESGRSTVLIADARGDSVLILANGRIVENVRFGEEMGVDIRATQDVTLLCMNPRGYADQDCNSFSSTVKMSFVQGNQSMSLEILPLGQIRW